MSRTYDCVSITVDSALYESDGSFREHVWKTLQASAEGQRVLHPWETEIIEGITPRTKKLLIRFMYAKGAML